LTPVGNKTILGIAFTVNGCYRNIPLICGFVVPVQNFYISHILVPPRRLLIGLKVFQRNKIQVDAIELKRQATSIARLKIHAINTGQ
jgi:hypothetical protein